ncbi:MAG: DUF1730 domain-containing protein [Victivallaceae bacterium]|nr:DUF1730 domain-containing protein [Victivallaceae bacterium]
MNIHHTVTNFNKLKMIFSTEKPDFASIFAVLRLSPELDRELCRMLPERPPDWSPQYLADRWSQRRFPSRTFPWAKSLIIMTIPFQKLPLANLPEAPEDFEFSGKISSYAARLDYHRAAHQMLAPYAQGTRCEIAVDTAPLAERTLACIAGIGNIGLNHCLLVPDGSSCFIASILSDAELPEIRFPRPDYCKHCMQCLDRCPNRQCAPEHCISYLTMEKRGALTAGERQILGNWIFGCSQCVNACPAMPDEKDFNLDLEWLLNSSINDVNKLIRNTPLNYAGITLLRRNALYVLANRGTRNCRTLIRNFGHKTGSRMLQQICSEL